MSDTLRVRGLREFIKACDHADRAVKRGLRNQLKAAGEIVAVDARKRFEQYSPESARTFRVVVRQRGVAVEQSRRKTTGERPDWGNTQMKKGLLPAAADKQEEIEFAVEMMLDRVIHSDF